MKLGALLFGALALGACSRDAKDTPEVACREMVLGKLKAPTTAQFNTPMITGPDPADVRGIVIFGQVDAQNTYGAQLRATFRCRLVRDSAAKKWAGFATVVSP